MDPKKIHIPSESEIAQVTKKVTNGKRGWMIYLRQAVVIANSRGVSRGILPPSPKEYAPAKEPITVTGYVVTDPHYVDYNPPAEPYPKLDPMKFMHNPFGQLRQPEFIESSSVEDPAYVGEPEVPHKR